MEIYTFHAAALHGLQHQLGWQHSVEIPSLRGLVKELHPVSSHWIDLGLQLDLPYSQLIAIQIEHHSPEEALRMMLETWLRQSPQPTWKTIVEALSVMNENGIAETIKARHCYNH